MMTAKTQCEIMEGPATREALPYELLEKYGLAESHSADAVGKVIARKR